MNKFLHDLRDCRQWTDEELTSQLHKTVARERDCLVDLLVRLGEFDRRSLSLTKGYPDLYEYCMRSLKYSRSGAARRIAAARAGRKYPSLLVMLASGELSLVGAAMLGPHLRPDNRRRLSRAVRGRTQEEVAQLIAAIAPQYAKRDSIRILSASNSAIEDRSSASAAISISPLVDAGVASPIDSAAPGGVVANPAHESKKRAVALYTASITITQETRDLLKRAQEVLRHQAPKGELDPILRMALELLLDKFDRDRRKPRAGRPSKRSQGRSSRHIPEAVKQEVWKRDGGQCTYVGEGGLRCSSRACMEFDHKKPFARGGRSDSPDNIRAMCRAHNQLLGRLEFGYPPGSSYG